MPCLPHPHAPLHTNHSLSHSLTIIWQLCERLQEFHEGEVVPVANLVRLWTGQHADQRREDVPDDVAGIVTLARQVQHYSNYLQRKYRTPHNNCREQLEMALDASLYRNYRYWQKLDSCFLRRYRSLFQSENICSNFYLTWFF